MKFKDISVVVLDAAGRELVSKTQPGCPPLIPHIAKAKAGAVIGTHSSSRALKDKCIRAKARILGAIVSSARANRRFDP